MSVYFLRWPGGRGTYRLQFGWNKALRTALQMARRTGRPILIRAQGRAPARTIGFVPGAPVAAMLPDGRVKRLRAPSQGVGDTLTDWACESQSFAQSWAQRVNDSLNTGTQAAALGAGIAGLLGAVVKRPLLGAAVGAAVGWGTHAIWTAPQRVS